MSYADYCSHQPPCPECGADDCPGTCRHGEPGTWCGLCDEVHCVPGHSHQYGASDYCPWCGADMVKLLEYQFTNDQSNCQVHPRSTFEYWLKKAGQTGSPDQVKQALRMMVSRELPVRACDADKILNLSPGTTEWFNKAGAVPAQTVLDEIERAEPE